MDQLSTYVILLSIIALLSQVFQKSTLPIALVLVIVGMMLGFVPFFPTIHLDSKLVLNLFLPLLVYEISAFSSWREMKKQIRPIALLSLGHVLFMTAIVAIVIHWLIPDLGWALAFVLGAILSPPDTVAIVSVAEKIKIPERIFTILKGEGMFNDAAALTLFRFALAAAITNQFSFSHAFFSFNVMIAGEALYGFLLGHLLGKIRSNITDTGTHILVSLITPFLAYLPMVAIGSTGIIATAMVGFIIGNQYTLRFTSEYRITSIALWPTFEFIIQGLIFLLVGLDMRATLLHISSIPVASLALYVGSILTVIIIGRFIWVYAAVYFLPRFFFPAIRKKDPYPPWQYPFVIAWSGMRGGISLAAALAVPALTLHIGHVDPRDLLVFLVFCTIIATLILQGLSLPWILKKTGIDKISQSERYAEHISELHAREHMLDAALHWLHQYKKESKHNQKLLTEIAVHTAEYQHLKSVLHTQISEHAQITEHDEDAEIKARVSLLLQVSTVEKAELTRLWREDKINLRTRTKLMAMLDHQIQQHKI